MHPRVALVPSLVLTALGAAFLGSPAAQAGGGGCDLPATSGAGSRVEMKDVCFLPTVLEVAVGQAVTWSNLESLPHTVTGSNAAWGGHASLALEDSATYTFATPGVYPYYCAFHPGMVGAVVVAGPEGADGATDAAMGGRDDTDDGIPRAAYAALGGLLGVVSTGAGLAVLGRR